MIHRLTNRSLNAILIAFAGSALMIASCAPKSPPTTPGATSLSADIPTRPEELPEPSPLEFDPPTPYTTTLSNGIKLYILENHELPLVNIDVIVANGSRAESPEEFGTAGFTADIMRRGGGQRFTGDALDDTLDFLGANISVGMSVEAATANLNVLTEHLDVGLEIFADVLINPVFPQDKIEELKRIRSEQIRRRDENPAEISRRKFRQVVYGNENPWARQLELVDIERITREDLREFHDVWFRPNITAMAISGDVDRSEIITKLESAFGDWQQRPVPEIELPPVVPGMAKGVYIYPKDVSQAAIRLGSTGMERHSPDQYAVEVLNRIFGAGTFTSRLGTEVRSNRGLAYYVYGTIFSDPDPRQGMLIALAGTRVDRAHETIEVMQNIIDQMDTAPITDEELTSSKDQIVQSFVFEYASPTKIVGQKMWMDYLGYPADYLDTYIDKIQDVTREDVYAAAQKYMNPEDLRILVVGPPEQLRESLADFGPVTVLPTDDEAAAMR